MCLHQADEVRHRPCRVPDREDDNHVASASRARKHVVSHAVSTWFVGLSSSLIAFSTALSAPEARSAEWALERAPAPQSREQAVQNETASFQSERALFRLRPQFRDADMSRAACRSRVLRAAGQSNAGEQASIVFARRRPRCPKIREVPAIDSPRWREALPRNVAPSGEWNCQLWNMWNAGSCANTSICRALSLTLAQASRLFVLGRAHFVKSL